MQPAVVMLTTPEDRITVPMQNEQNIHSTDYSISTGHQHGIMRIDTTEQLISAAIILSCRGACEFCITAWLLVLLQYVEWPQKHSGCCATSLHKAAVADLAHPANRHAYQHPSPPHRLPSCRSKQKALLMK